jgi:hypothetical protein
MKPILIDDISREISSEHRVKVWDKHYSVWKTAKPLDYEYGLLTKIKHAYYVLTGKAIAIKFFDDFTEEEKIELYREWRGTDGRLKMITFFKKLYENQKGRCAVSNQPMTLTVGTRVKNSNKCSPDRKNSNKGYSPDNIWFVVWWVNAMKMDMPMITFWKRVDILAESRFGGEHQN